MECSGREGSTHRGHAVSEKRVHAMRWESVHCVSLNAQWGSVACVSLNAQWGSVACVSREWVHVTIPTEVKPLPARKVP
jgi:hypothetical protein